MNASNANLEFIDALNNLTPTLKAASKLSKSSSKSVNAENINNLNANNLNGK